MPMPISEIREIIQSAKRGDVDAFEKILTVYEQQIFHYLYKILGQRQDAEDATQETFLKIYKNLKKIDLQKNFRAWLYKIATNTAYDRLRKKKLRPELFLDDINTIETMEDESAYDRIEGIENKKVIEEALQKIKPGYKSILLLFYKEELSYEEIAEALSIPLNTVKSHIFRAKKSLKNELTKNI
jgi:RNA polymerase sigma-70 factor, ECF subfamily